MKSLPTNIFSERDQCLVIFLAPISSPPSDAPGILVPFRVGYTLGRRGEAEPVPEAGLRRKASSEAFV